MNYDLSPELLTSCTVCFLSAFNPFRSDPQMSPTVHHPHPHPNLHPNHTQDHDIGRHPTLRQMADFVHFQGNSDAAMLSAEMTQIGGAPSYLPHPQQQQQQQQPPSHTLSPISPSHSGRLDDWGAHHPQFANYHGGISGPANRSGVHPQGGGFLNGADDLVQVSDPLADGYDCFMTDLGATTPVFQGEGALHQVRTASNALCESIKSDIDRQYYDEAMDHVTSGHAQSYYSVLQGQGIGVGGQEMVGGPYHAYLMNMGGTTTPFYDDYAESTAALSPNNPRSTWLKFSQ